MSSSVSIYMIQMHEQSWTYVSENAPCASSEGICWGMILAVENFGSLQERWWQSVGMGACPIFRRKSSWFGFFWKGVEQCWTSTGPKTWVFFVVWRRILGFRWLVWIGVIQRGREFDHFMLGKVTDYVPRSILWIFQLVRIFLYYGYIYIYMIWYSYDISMIFSSSGGSLCSTQAVHQTLQHAAIILAQQERRGIRTGRGHVEIPGVAVLVAWRRPGGWQHRKPIGGILSIYGD